MHVRDILPRLSRIQEIILNATGRNPATTSTRSNSIELKSNIEVDSTEEKELMTSRKPGSGYRLNEIISYSNSVERADETDILKFSLSSKLSYRKEEAVGASLLLYIDRRRNIRKGGKGKRILIEISERTQNNTWQILSMLRTRVKKRRWKRVSLPVKAAQDILDSKVKSLDLRIRCLGCGRLVQVVLDKFSSFENTKETFKTNNITDKDNGGRDSETNNNVRKKRHKHLIRRQRNSGSPILIISTRIPV